jgi:hypothetical protein
MNAEADDPGSSRTGDLSFPLEGLKCSSNRGADQSPTGAVSTFIWAWMRTNCMSEGWEKTQVQQRGWTSGGISTAIAGKARVGCGGWGIDACAASDSDNRARSRRKYLAKQRSLGSEIIYLNYTALALQDLLTSKELYTHPWYCIYPYT